MYWSKPLELSDLQGQTFVHGIARLNLSATDIDAFVRPADAALIFGFRALEEGDPFEQSVAVWMATLRRRGGSDAIMESLQRIFTQMADAASMEHLLGTSIEIARGYGYQKLWIAPAVSREPLFAPALAPISKTCGPVEMVPSSGMIAIPLSATRS